MRSAGLAPLALVTLFVSACSLAENGLGANDAGARGPGLSGGIDSGAPSKGGGGVDAGAPAHVPVDAGSPADAAPPIDAKDGAPSTLGPFDFDVPATDGPSCTSWFDTGIDLPLGADASLVATGTWQYGLGAVFQCGPEGAQINDPMTGMPYGALVAQIAGAPPVLVGASLDTKVAAAGRLQLGMNDDVCNDNVGTMHVVVTVHP
jgi:hypothetical protein